ncbi:MAG: metallophosphoesterase [Pseudomonadales bacterium]|nr:metallophosphoesterase [Pseudomonadales bacterium]NRA17536.1 metallophosphoesterase [Oceanospirillaceae bacterium]
MQALRVVQITDIHLLPQPGDKYYQVDTAASLEAVIAEINQLEPKVDMVIASGDLSEDGAAATYQRLAKILAQLPVPVYVTAGNHDDPQLMSTHLQSANINITPSAEVANWGFIFLDSQVAGQSHGLLSAQQLHDIDSYLSHNPDRPVLMALHHPTFTVCPLASCQLQNAGELQQLLLQHNNLRLVIAGHTHNDETDQSQRYSQYTTPSTFAHATHKQELAEHSEQDFWAGHQLDGATIGFRVLDLMADASFTTKVHWLKV